MSQSWEEHADTRAHLDARCPNCMKLLSFGCCTNPRCAASVSSGPDPDFLQLRRELGDTRFFGILDRFGFASLDQVRTRKMRAVIGFVMRRHLAELQAFAMGGTIQ
jgi:hypothetical protein